MSFLRCYFQLFAVPPPSAFFCWIHRVIQLGLRRDTLAAFRGPAFGEGGIEDVTAFAHATAAEHGGGEGCASVDGMLLPVEEPYTVQDVHAARRLGID